MPPVPCPRCARQFVPRVAARYKPGTWCPACRAITRYGQHYQPKSAAPIAPRRRSLPARPNYCACGARLSIAATGSTCDACRYPIRRLSLA